LANRGPQVEGALSLAFYWISNILRVKISYTGVLIPITFVYVFIPHCCSSNRTTRKTVLKVAAHLLHPPFGFIPKKPRGTKDFRAFLASGDALID
jgi:hypothetical protein